MARSARVSRRPLAAALLGGLVASGAAAAQGPEPVLGAQRVVQMAIGLAVVTGLILAAAWLLRRVLGVRSGRGAGMRVLGALSLGARERAVLVEVGSRQLLLGVAPGRVETLHVLEEPLAIGAEERGRFDVEVRAAARRLGGEAGR